jgi:uncharacterized protein with HEPN domain
MRPREDTVLLNDMLDYARRAVDAAEGGRRADLDTDPVLVGALERFVEVIGEAATRLSEGTRASTAEIPWHEIIAMRNRLVHGYFAVDLNILWTVVKEDLPSLIEALELLVASDTELSE